MNKIKEYIKKFAEFIYKYRILICIFVFILCVLLKLHGSSIGIYRLNIQYGSNNSEFSRPIIGQSRLIRSDEYNIHTQMALSQKFVDYNIENSLWRNAPTNMATIYNQPVKAFFSIVKPFHWGYLITKDNEYGLSWYWCGRTIFLLLVSFEFFMILTRRKRRLSLIGSVLIVYSPLVQWWFAVNDLVEQLFWAELGVICLYYFLRTESYKLKLILSIIIGLCISGYILCLYPAWQIPFAYCFGIIAFYILYTEWNSKQRTKIDIIYPVISILLATGVVLNWLIPCLPVIEIIRDTVYPGQRTCLGGNMFFASFYYLVNSNIYTFENECELAQFAGLFPLPAILCGLYLYKNKFNDKLILPLLCLEFFLLWYLGLGFFEPFGKLTLMNYTTVRAAMVISFIDIILLIRLFSKDEKIKTDNKIFLSFTYSLTVFFAIYNINIQQFIFNTELSYQHKAMPYIGFIAAFIVSFVVMKALEGSEKIKTILFTCVLVLSIVFCGFINPVMKGLNCIYNIPVIQEIKKINDENPGKWLSLNHFLYTNLPTLVGVETVNTTNIYPNFDLYYRFDEEKEQEEIYNRYTDFQVFPSEDSTSKYYMDDNNILITLFVAYNDLPKFGADYIFTVIPEEPYKGITGDISFEKLYDYNGAYIYKIHYKDEALKIYEKYKQTN
ncbi:hypothetical protein II906_08350 [bacterium]|nr:hypothetical protein [bacterium]